MKKIISAIILLIAFATTIQANSYEFSTPGYKAETPVYNHQYKQPFSNPQEPLTQTPSGTPLRADGWLDNPYGDDDNNLKITPVSDGLIVLLLLVVGYVIFRNLLYFCRLPYNIKGGRNENKRCNKRD